MTENVGRTDQAARALAGATLLGLGARWLARDDGWRAALASLAGGILVETAITRTCPLNAVFGIDSRTNAERIEDARRASSTIHMGAQRETSNRLPVG